MRIHYDLTDGIDAMLLTSKLSSSRVFAYRIISGGMAAILVLDLSITSTLVLHAKNSRDSKPMAADSEVGNVHTDILEK